jgi:hypothetical protein
MIHEVGSWQHFVKRQDNVGLPIMEVKQKYLKEMNSNPINLSNIDEGGGSRRVTSTPPTVYNYTIYTCDPNTPGTTVYSLDPYFESGFYVYYDFERTQPLNGVFNNTSPQFTGLEVVNGLITSTVVDCGG